MIRDKKSLGKKIWDSPLNPVKKFDNAIQVLSVPSALIAEGYEAYTGKGDGKFNFSDAMPKEWGFVGDGGKQKEIGNLMYPNADWKKQTAVTLATDPTTYITGGGALKGISTVGGKILKKAGKQIKKIKIKPMEKIGKFNMPHSPLNYKERNEHVVDSTNLAKTNPAKAAMIYGPNLEASLEGAYQEGVNQNQWRLKDNPDMDLSGYGEKSQDQYFTDLRSGQFDQQYADDFNRALSKNIKKLRYVVPNQKGFPSTGEMSDFPTETVTRGQIGKVRKSWFGNDERSDSALNYKDDFDVDYSGAKAVDLGNIPASDFTKAKKKLVEGYGGPNNPDYRMDKGDYYWSEKKGKIRSGYTEYPEDAGDIDPRYLGKNWDNEEVYNMTPNATEAESKAVRDKFDATYMKRNK